MKIATFNVNSLRVRQQIVLDWLSQHKPDVLCVQETKVQDKDFPADAFADTGYEFIFKGQKSYNGVAIFSLHKFKDVKIGFDDEPTDGPRLIKAKIGKVNVVNTYIPQGYMPESEKFQYKLLWLKRLRKFFDDNFKPSDLIVWTGDLNAAMEDKDVHDPIGLKGHVCFCDETTKAIQKVIDFGFVDTFRLHNSDPGQYTFWDYRLRTVTTNQGWRLDYIFATAPLAKKCTSCIIDKKPRTLNRPSDHTPLFAEFDV